MENSGSLYKIITLNLLWVTEVTFLQEQNASSESLHYSVKGRLSGILVED